ncbi:FAD-dependent monooxygenase [Streptomyces sp. NPDC001691]|uniref:FAD-dependent monooxygenase n=1 Tax=Streptomyces sp. NPDC001691 TaxID=3364600 RepID=UPI00368E3710
MDRGDHWQCAGLITKGTDAERRTEGLDRFMARFTNAVPWLADRAHSVTSWDEVKLLDVRLDRLRRWHRAGLLCIGDAAPAMSPVLGIGINLAVQDPQRAKKCTQRVTDSRWLSRLPAYFLGYGALRERLAKASLRGNETGREAS